MSEAAAYEDGTQAAPSLCADQLLHLGSSLPRHIQQTVLPHLTEEIHSCAAELSAQVDGTRHLLLQSAVLRRSAVLAPLLRQQYVTSASHLQRRRAQLVQVLQHKVKQWRTAPSSSSSQVPRSLSDGSASSGVKAVSGGDLQEVWAILEAAMAGEERHAYIVQAPLRPSNAALRRFLAEAVTQQKLHRRVMAQVGDEQGEAGNAKAASTSASGNNTKGQAPTPALQSDSAAPGGTEDAIEAALQLLLRCIEAQDKRTTSTAQGTKKPGTDTKRHVKESTPLRPASPAVVTTTTTTINGGSSGSGTHRTSPAEVVVEDVDAHGGAVCTVDSSSEVEVDDAEEADVMAEEDLDAYNSPTSAQPCGKPASHQDATTPGPAESFTSHTSPCGPWLRIPGLLSLRQYCADLPWVAEMAEQRYAEARERKKHSGNTGSGGSGGGDIGYFSRHVPADEAGAREGGKDSSLFASSSSSSPSPPPTPQHQTSAVVFSTLAPFGGYFSPSLAIGPATTTTTTSTSSGSSEERRGAAVSTSSNATADSTLARAMRQAAAGSASASSGSAYATATDREGTLFVVEPQLGERAAVARGVVRCVVPAVDAAWQDVEEKVLLPFCTAAKNTAGGQPLKQAHNTDDNLNAKRHGGEGRREVQEGNEVEEEEEEIISSFLEVVRVRYAVELAAQVVAARQAVELLLDSEDSVIFDDARLTSLSLETRIGTETHESSGGELERGKTGLAKSGAAATSSGVLLSSSVLTCTVLSLPGLAEIFYVVAYGVGAAMLRESASAAAGGSLKGSPEFLRGAAPMVIDVDATDAEADSVFTVTNKAVIDLADEEDTAAHQRAALQAWATNFERCFLSRCTPANSFASPATRDTPHFAGLFRLWLYLWEYVLATPQPAALSSSTISSSPSAPASTPLSTSAMADGHGKTHAGASTYLPPTQRGARTSSPSSSSPSQLLLSLRTARRWMEKVLQASLHHGCKASGAVSSSYTPPQQQEELLVLPESCLPSCVRPAEAERIVRRTTAEARQALMHAAGADTSA